MIRQQKKMKNWQSSVKKKMKEMMGKHKVDAEIKVSLNKTEKAE